MTIQNSSLHNLLKNFQILHTNTAKSVLMVAPLAIIFIEFLLKWSKLQIILMQL